MPASLTLLVNVVLPVFALMIVGAVVGRAFDLHVRSINRLSLYAVLPALAFRAMANLEFGDIAAPFSIRRADGDSWVEAGRVRPADL